MSSRENLSWGVGSDPRHETVTPRVEHGYDCNWLSLSRILLWTGVRHWATYTNVRGNTMRPHPNSVSLGVLEAVLNLVGSLWEVSHPPGIQTIEHSGSSETRYSPMLSLPDVSRRRASDQP